MSRLAGLSARKVVAAFGRAGYAIARQRGSHIILQQHGKPFLVIPAHRVVSPFLLRSQIRRAGLTEEEFVELL